MRKTWGSFLGVAHAAPVTVYEAPITDRNQQVSAAFDVNRELGRAWIDVQIQSEDVVGEEPPDQQIIMRQVDGLSYDPVRKQVLYQTAGGTTVCAEDASFLWTTYLKSTGQCQLTPRTEQRKMDDGFNIRERTVAKVVFEAQP